MATVFPMLIAIREERFAAEGAREWIHRAIALLKLPLMIRPPDTAAVIGTESSASADGRLIKPLPTVRAHRSVLDFLLQVDNSARRLQMSARAVVAHGIPFQPQHVCDRLISRSVRPIVPNLLFLQRRHFVSAPRFDLCHSLSLLSHGHQSLFTRQKSTLYCSHGSHVFPKCPNAETVL